VRQGVNSEQTERFLDCRLAARNPFAAIEAPMHGGDRLPIGMHFGAVEGRKR